MQVAGIIDVHYGFIHIILVFCSSLLEAYDSVIRSSKCLLILQIHWFAGHLMVEVFVDNCENLIFTVCIFSCDNASFLVAR